MIDIKLLRDEPDRLRAAIARKKFACDFDALLALDERRRATITAAEQARARQKGANQEMAKVRHDPVKFQEKLLETRSLSERAKALQAEQQEAEAAWTTALLGVPNLPHESVPDGDGEAGNVTVKTGGDAAGDGAAFPHAKPHFDIPWFNAAVNLEAGSKVTGAGFPFLVGDVARLMRGLIQFCLQEITAAGFIEFMPPLLVNADSATATGQLPDKDGQMYHVGGDDFYLIPTSEVPVTNFFRDAVFDPGELPIYRTAYTPCFRREAGSYGKDVRGLNRLHQFDKVEMVKWVDPATSYDELESLLATAEGLLQKLGLPYRQLLICSGDIGFPHAKQYDLEVWAAGQARWLEVSSCSNFTDFQARRANIRYRGEDGKPRFVHTLNGSGLGLPRTLAALLENNLREDGRVDVPEVLRPWVGAETIGG